MWLARLVMRPILPLARGRDRFSGEAWSAVICTIRRPSRSMSMLFSALAAADCSTLATCLAQGDVSRLKVSRASSTPLPRTISSIGLSRLVDAPICLATALTGGTLPHHPTGPLGTGDVAAVGARRGEFSQAMTYHILGNEDWDMTPSVMNADGHSQQVTGR